MTTDKSPSEREQNLIRTLVHIDGMITELVHSNAVYLDSKNESGFYEQEVGSIKMVVTTLRDIERLIVNTIDLPEPSGDEEHVCTYCELKKKLIDNNRKEVGS